MNRIVWFYVVLVLAAGLALASCSPSQSKLTLVHGSVDAAEEIAALLVAASQDADTSIRLELGAPVDGPLAALDAVSDGTVDLAIVENGDFFDYPAVRTVVPLYPSVLHIAVRAGRQGGTLRELFEGATVYAGAAGSPAVGLIATLRETYQWSGASFTVVNDPASDPDIIVLFAPISPRRVGMFEGYDLFSIGDPAALGAGTEAEALSLVVPRLKPFVIPAGTYGSKTPSAVLTVATNALLVSNRETSRVTIFDLLQELQAIGPRLVTSRPDLIADRFDDFDIAGLTFPLHSGAVAFRARNEPGFFERATEFIDALFATLAALGATTIGIFRYVKSTRKSRIDRIYASVLAVRARLQSGIGGDEISRIRNEVRAIRDEAFDLLMREKLNPDESFQILQALIRDVLRELESEGRPASHSGTAAA